MTAYADFLADPGRVELWLFEPVGLNTNTSTEQTFYFSSRQYGTESGDTPSSQRYDSCIVRGFEFAGAIEAPSGPVYGILPARVGGSIVLGQNRGALDLGELAQLAGVPLREFAFGGRSAVVRHGGHSPRLGRDLTYAEMQVVFNGEIDGEPLIGIDSVEFRLRSKDDRFQYPIQTRTYFGCKGAVWFDGTNDYVTCSNGSVFNFTSSDFSVEFLLYFDAAPGTECPIINRGSPTIDGWSVRLATTGAIKFQTNQSGVVQTTTSSVVTAKRWARISVCRSGAACTIYIDGVASNAVSGTHIDPTTATRTLYLGRNDGGTLFFQGMLSDVRIWSTCRTVVQVNSLKHRPLDSSEYAATGLAGYWPADDGTGTTLDQKVVATGSGYDGTLTSGAKLVPSLMGGDDLQGSLIPETWGYVRGFSPVLVHEGTRIYQIHSGSVSSIDRIDVGAVSGTTLDTAYTNLLTFLNDTTTAGQHDTCITSGGTYIRLGSSPSKPLTVELQGDNEGSTFRSTAGDLIRYIVCNRGWYPLTDPTDLDTDSFDDLDTANDADCGVAYRDERSVADIVNGLLQSVGAVGWFARDTGLFTVQQFTGVSGKSSPTVTVTERDIALDSLEVIESGPPIHRVGIQYRRNYTPLSTTDLAAGVAGTSQELFVRKEWRRADYTSATVKATYKDARSMIYSTYLDKWADAIVEAERQGAMFASPAQAFRFLCRKRGLDLDRMATVYFDYGDLDEFGARQNRFGTSDTAVFIVLEASDDAESGGTYLTIWREAA